MVYYANIPRKIHNHFHEPQILRRDFEKWKEKKREKGDMILLMMDAPKSSLDYE